MRPFAYERAADAAGAVARARRARRRARYLGGGTNLVDLMKLGRRDARRCSSTSRACPHDRIEEHRRRRPAHRRRRCATATWPPTRASASATRCWPRRCSPAPPASCATSRPSAATSCSAPAAPTSRTSPSRATSASRGHRLPGARGRPPQPRDPRALARHCVATHPSDMAVALAALDADRPRARPGRRAHDPDARPAPPARRRARSATPCSRRASSITAVELPPLPPAALALPQGARPRVVRVRARLGRRGARRRATAPCATAASRSAASRTSRGGRARAEEALRGAPATEAAFARRRRRRARRGASRCATTPSRSPLRARPDRPHARGADRDDRRIRTRGDRRARSTRVEGREKVTGAGPLRLRAPGRGRRLRRDRAGRRSPAGASRASTRRRARAARACSPCSGTTTRRALREVDDARAARASRTTASPTAGRSSPPWSPRRSRSPARRRGRVRVDYRGRGRTTSCCAPTTRGCTRPSRSTRLRRPTREHGDVDAALAAARGRRIDVTYTTPGVPQQPDGAARDAGRLGRTATLTIYDSTQGAATARDTVAQVLRAGARAACASISQHVGGGFGSKGTPRPQHRARGDGRPHGRAAR